MTMNKFDAALQKYWQRCVVDPNNRDTKAQIFLFDPEGAHVVNRMAVATYYDQTMSWRYPDIFKTLKEGFWITRSDGSQYHWHL
jgi:hypothetical protein